MVLTSEIDVRPLEKFDVEGVMEAEIASCSFYDDLTDTLKSRPWLMTEKRLYEVIRQRATDGHYSTRVYVVDDGDGCVGGAFAFEVAKESYDVFWFVSHPDLVAEDIVGAMADYLKGRADKSPKRKTIKVFLRDADEARLREYLPVWRAAAFSCKLRPNYYDGVMDAWELTFKSVKVSKSDESLEEAM